MGKNTPFLNLYKPGGGATGTNVPDETADIDRVNANFDLIDNNAKSDDTRLDALEAANTTQGKFLVPTGMIMIWPVNTSVSPYPVGWYVCNGQAVSRTGAGAALFAVIGTTFGDGDGSTTFNVPNLKGRVPVGFDSAQTEFNTLAETGGAKTVTLSQANLPSSAGGRLVDDTAFDVSGANRPVVAGSGTRHQYLTQAATAHQNMPPYLVVNYLIKN